MSTAGRAADLAKAFKKLANLGDFGGDAIRQGGRAVENGMALAGKVQSFAQPLLTRSSNKLGDH